MAVRGGEEYLGGTSGGLDFSSCLNSMSIAFAKLGLNDLFIWVFVSRPSLGHDGVKVSELDVWHRKRQDWDHAVSR